ncbi:MAG: DUF3300 domain-containing protein [Gammaproteobacteria bacterium]
MRHPQSFGKTWSVALIAAASLGLASPVLAQTAVRDDAPIVVETLSSAELQNVVGPVALYPDDLLAVVLPASAFPLQIVQASRFLDDYEQDNSLKPDPTWDESVVALLNYPEVLRLMNDDLDWTYDLGAAVVNQQPDVIAAIETFRDRAYDAGNLKSDNRQVVEREDDRITITPVEREVVYVPYYEPERVVVVQRAPVFHYYPRAFPLYYYPYPAYHSFNNGFFFGVTSAYRIGWRSRFLGFHLHNYVSHPFYGRRYVNNFYYHNRFQPARFSNRAIARSRGGYANNRNYRGDQWRPVSQRNVRGIARTGQRAARVNRAPINTQFKPRDSRNRSVNRQGNARSVGNRSIAPKSRVANTNRGVSNARNTTTRRSATTNRTRVATADRQARTTQRRAPSTTSTRQFANRSATSSNRATTSRQYTTQRTARTTTRAPQANATNRSTRQAAQTRSAPQRQVTRSAPTRQAAPARQQSSAPARTQSSKPARSQRSQARSSNSSRSSRSNSSRSRSSNSSRNSRR